MAYNTQDFQVPILSNLPVSKDTLRICQYDDGVVFNLESQEFSFGNMAPQKL